MAYTPHNFEPGDTLSADIFNELEQTVHDLGGSFVDFKEYIVAKDPRLYGCTFVSETENSYLITQDPNYTSLTAYCAIFSLGTFGSIKDKTFYFKISDVSGDPTSLINKVDLHLSTVKDFNYGRPHVLLNTSALQNVKK